MIQKLFYFLIFFLLTFGASAQLKPVDKQYIKNAPWNKNPGFEQGKSNYSLYKDADQALPENMTGGTSDLSIALNSTNPIDGNRDLIITKGGSTSRRGNGLSFPVTIPSGMQGQMVEICFQYRTSSGYLDDQVIVYAYDVTNASLASTEPAPMQLKAYAASTGSATHCAYVQAVSNSTSYRVGLHVSGTSDVDYTITIDNFTVGKVSTTNGAVVTAWKEYTPTGRWTTNVTYTGSMRRVGDTAQFFVKALFSGAPDAGNFSINMPAGMVIDTTKQLGNASTGSPIYGSAKIIGTGVMEGFVTYESNTSVIVEYISSVSTGNTIVTKSAPFTIGNTHSIELVFQVPIVGWQATGILGQDATTQVIGAYTTGSATTFAAATTLVPTTISKDFTGRMSAAGVYTVDVAGLYFIGGTISTSTSTTYITFGYIKNGGAFTYLGGEQTAGTTYNTASGTTVQYLVAGDTIAFQGLASASVAADVQCNTYVIRMSGPANVMPSETIEEVRVNSAGTAFGADGVTVSLPFATSEKSTHGSYVTNTFTAPISGAYLAAAHITVVSNGTAADQFFDLFVTPNNSQGQIWIRSTKVPVSTLVTLSGSKIFNLTKGQTITTSMRAYYSSGSAPTLYNNAGMNSISIIRVGNY